MLSLGMLSSVHMLIMGICWKLWKMDLEGIRPDYVTLVSVLNACSSLSEGKRIHRRATDSGFDTFIPLARALIAMYGRFKSLSGARATFENMTSHDESSWNTIILAFAHNGDFKSAVEFFNKMHVCKTVSTYVNLLFAFTSKDALPEARKIHEKIYEDGLLTDIVMGTALITMYGKCRSPDEAERVFNEMKEHDTVSWNAMLTSYVGNSKYVQAVDLYRRMDLEGISRGKPTFVSILVSCSCLRDIKQGESVHMHVVESGLEMDTTVGTALVNMYAKCGRVPEARDVFDGMKEKDSVAWGTMISCYMNSGLQKEAFHLYKEMLTENVDLKPDNITFTSILGACSTLSDCQHIHDEIVKNKLEHDVVVGTALLTAYGRISRLDHSRSVFEGLKTKDIVSWNAMITAYLQNGNAEGAIEVYTRMSLEPDAVTYISILEACSSLGRISMLRLVHSRISQSEYESDVLVKNTLVNAYARTGKLEEAEALFAAAKVKSVVSWTAMVAGYAQFGQYQKAFETLQNMELEGSKPDAVTYASLLFVCTHHGGLKEAWKNFSNMVVDHDIEPRADHYAAIVDLLGRSGRLNDAKELLETMPFKPDETAWMPFLSSCRIHGNLELAEFAAEQMYEVDPDCTAPYIVLSNIYAARGLWEKVAEVRKAMEKRGLKKLPGLSWIEIGSKVYEFSAGEKHHPRRDEIVRKLVELDEIMKAEGYVADTSVVVRDVNEDEKRKILLLHSERMAIGFGLLCSSSEERRPIQVVKNLRVCSDCHTATKFISKIVGRDIIVRDCNRFHRFSPDGKCSCGDYW